MMFIPDMPNKEYHRSKGISKTGLDLFAKDPNALEWAYTCPTDDEKLKTFDFGDAMHAICLEPDRLKSEFIMAPAFNLRTNQGKSDKEAFYKENEGKKILTDAEHKQLNLMFESVMAHPEARALIESEGVAEGSWFWTDKETGINCKCRPDKQIGNILVDVKTTPDLSKFCYSVEDFRYYVQDPWYCDGVMNCGLDNVTMKFLVIQKNIECGRYPVRVVRLPQEAIDYGRIVYRRDLLNYAYFLENGSETQELQMHYRFMSEAMEYTTEIKYG